MKTNEVLDIVCWKIKTPFRRLFYSVKYIWYKKNRFLFYDDKDTVRMIIEEGYSLCRFGDGELRWAYGIRNHSFQINNEHMQSDLRGILDSETKNKIIIALNELINNTDGIVSSDKAFWKEFCVKYEKEIISRIPKNRIYGRANISRPYMNYLDKNTENCKKRFDLVRKIWDEKDVVFVEGEYTRLGVGNDLFDNAHTIQRIICPAQNAYSQKEQIKVAMRELGEDFLFILALGPTATIIAFEMANEGYHCIDVGHIDIEYMWFIQGARYKQPVEGKFVQEAGGFPQIIQSSEPRYENEICKRIL